MLLYIIIILYLLSVFGAYMFFRKAYSYPDGMFRSLDLDFTELFAVIFPICNTFFALDYLMGNYRYKKKHKNTKIFNKIFGVRKD